MCQAAGRLSGHQWYPGRQGLRAQQGRVRLAQGPPGLLQWGHGGESFQGQDGPGAQSRGGAENSVPRPRAAPHCTCAGVNRSTGPQGGAGMRLGG